MIYNHGVESHRILPFSNLSETSDDMILSLIEMI